MSFPGSLFLFAATILLAAGTTGLAADRIPGESWMQYASPEAAGFDPALLAEARAYWESTRSAAVFVVYRGAVLVDWGETARRFHCHSVRKSLMSGIYGVYLDNGKIDGRRTMAELRIDDEPPLTPEEKQARIVDLLAARSGVYRLAAAEPPQNPKPPRGSHLPGTHWVYNNWDFNTLVTIFEQLTGTKFFTEFDARFAEPLGMQDYDPSHGYYFYEREKSIHPAYPIRMSARDMARYGLLYLYRGQWGKRRILSEAYIDESTAWISDTPSGGYGYMWWLEGSEPFKELGMYSALGIGGQSIDIIPGAEMVFINRADTYLEGSVSSDERTRMIRMILEARTGEPKKNPRLVPLPEPEPPYSPHRMTAAEMEPYLGDHPIADTGQSVSITAGDGVLTIDFGAGLIRLAKLGRDHFIVDDHLEHVYFEEDEAGRKLPIRADLLLMDGRGRLGAGDVAEATAVFEKAARYFPEDPRVYRAMADVHLVTAREAIDRAIASYARVEELRPDETLDKSRLAWELVALQARIAPVDLFPEQLERLTGSYGPRQVVYEGGELYYSRGDSPRAKLIPLTEMIFQHETLEWFRVRFDTDARGRISGITGLYRDGDRDENLRD